MLNLTRNVLKKVLNQCDKCCSSTYYLALRSQSSKGHVIESRVPEVKIPEVLIHEFIWNKLDKWHDRTALVRLMGIIWRISFTLHYNQLETITRVLSYVTCTSICELFIFPLKCSFICSRY